MLDSMTIELAAYAQAAALEFRNLLSPAWYTANFAALLQIIMIDIVLAGDNAIVVGLAASRVSADVRNKVIFWGITGAVLLRVFFAVIATKLLLIVGLSLAGGILLLWVCWKMYRQIVEDEGEQLAEVEAGLKSNSVSGKVLGFWPAVGTIVIADISMSLDNVLAVAGVAKDNTLVLVVGLAVSILLMALAAHFIARLLVRFPWITWIGLLIILYVAVDMIYRGSHEVACNTIQFGCSETLVEAVFHRLGIPVPDLGLGLGH